MVEGLPPQESPPPRYARSPSPRRRGEDKGGTMRIAFMGTPDFAVPTFEALLEAGHDVVAVYSQPPRPAGRGKTPRPSPVQRAAEAHGIEVRTPLTLRDPAEQQAFAALDLDA